MENKSSPEVGSQGLEKPETGGGVPLASTEKMELRLGRKNATRKTRNVRGVSKKDTL